jgi:hypothetical protein
MVDVRWMVFDGVWLVANAVICVGLAQLMMRR